ncbi:MAG: uroporphyrinogen decarboxylase family protein [Firmicutes bacterium]|nr:uroporphyrinogen decarboxylase family protein [Bacillota bacterium]
MSLEHGMAALRLETPPRVPRTEYSLNYHLELISAAAGVPVAALSDEKTRGKATKELMRLWNFDFNWNVCVSGRIFGDKVTRMGHAAYAAGGADYDDNVSRLFNDPGDVYGFDFEENFGPNDKAALIPLFNQNYADAAEAYPDMVNMTGVYVTCMSGLIDLLGWETLLAAAGLDGRRFGDFANRYAKWMEPYFIALAESDAPVVMLHDDIVWTSGPFLNPAWYREFLFPNYMRLFDYPRQKGKIICYTSDGNYTMFVDDIARCGANCFVMEPMTDMAYVAEKYGRTHSFIGNADTRILLGGTKEDIYSEVKRCMDIGKKCPGFFMAVGNHIPANTPVENALYYNEVYEKMSRR